MALQINGETAARPTERAEMARLHEWAKAADIFNKK